MDSKSQPIVEVINGIISMINKNIISHTNATSDIVTGDLTIFVENTFHLEEGQEIVFIDNGFNDSLSPHYNKYEYSVIDTIINTHAFTIQSPVIDSWLVSDLAFVQKTIGHSPLYSNRIYYGDRETIPTEEMAIAVEPVSMGNEWIYIQGGLSKEYRVDLMVYGKNIETESGMIVLNKYTDALYNLFNANIHLDITNYETPLLNDVNIGDNVVIIEDTTQNRLEFLASGTIPDDQIYELQDNNDIEIDFYCVSASFPGDGKGYITLNRLNPSLYGFLPVQNSYKCSDYAILRRHGRYLYDSRVDSISYGTVQKGSAYIRAAKLSWFGKEVEEHYFPQRSKGAKVFTEVVAGSSSSSSSSET